MTNGDTVRGFDSLLVGGAMVKMVGWSSQREELWAVVKAVVSMTRQAEASPDDWLNDGRSFLIGLWGRPVPSVRRAKVPSAPRLR